MTFTLAKVAPLIGNLALQDRAATRARVAHFDLMDVLTVVIVQLPFATISDAIRTAYGIIGPFTRIHHVGNALKHFAIS